MRERELKLQGDNKTKDSRISEKMHKNDFYKLAYIMVILLHIVVVIRLCGIPLSLGLTLGL